MKIAYLVPYIAQSGPLNVVKYLCKELKNEHNIDVFYFKDINNGVFPVETKRIGFFEKIDFNYYDIIHSHGVFPDAYIWWHNKSIKKVKTLTTLHNYVKEDYKYAYNPIKAFVLAKVWNIVTSKHDQVVTLSQDAIKYYKPFWMNKKLTFVYNGIPEQGVAYEDTRLFSHDNSVKIGLIGSGNITKRKGFDQVISALSKLKNYSVYIVGKGQELDNLQELARKLCLDDRVNFLGFQDDLGSFVDAMDIFVVPSRSEGFSLAIQEVARQRKPVVCSKIPIFEELFSNNEAVFFKLEDIEDLATAIERAYKNRDIFGEKIFQTFLISYSSGVMANNYLKLYHNMIKDTKR